MNPPTTVTTLSSYRNQTPYPFCPGCGHHSILDQLSAALNELRVDPEKVVLVTDIGCSGLSDQYFTTSAFHGLHGRSITYATGIKLARPDLKVIVVMGDGGTGNGARGGGDGYGLSGAGISWIWSGTRRGAAAPCIQYSRPRRRTFLSCRVRNLAASP